MKAKTTQVEYPIKAERVITTATDDSIEALTARVTALINSVGRGDPAIVAPLTEAIHQLNHAAAAIEAKRG